MKKFTFLLMILFAFVTTGYSQVTAPTANIFLEHKYVGSYTEVKPYSGGLVILGNDGTDDIVLNSQDGNTWAISESLQANKSSRLTGWAGSGLAYYYGLNAADADTVDLRTITDGSSSILINGGHGTNPALTTVTRMDYGGSTGPVYYYMARGTDAGQGIYNAIIYETDGTNWGTFEVAGARGVAVKVVAQNESGIMESVVFNNQLHILAGETGFFGPLSAIYTINYDENGSETTLFAESDNEVISWRYMTATSQYIYVIVTDIGTETHEMLAFDAAGTQYTVGTEQYAKVQPVVHGDTIIAVKQQNGSNISKLAIIGSPDNVNILNINPAGETDSISNLVVSGDKLFFTAVPTGGTENLYVLRLDVANAEPLLVRDLYYKLADMISLGDGNVAYAFNQSNSYSGGFVSVTEGFSYAGYDIHNGTSFAWTNGPIKLEVNGSELYVVDHSENSDTARVWKHTIDYTNYRRSNPRFYLNDVNTNAAIVGANVVIDNGVYTYSGVTNGSGYVDFTDIVGGTYYDYSFTATGYNPLTQTHKWMKEEYPDIYITMEEETSTGIHDTKRGDLTIYPQPVKDNLYLNSSDPIVHVELFNISGAVVKSFSDTGITKIDVSDLPNGIYIIKSTNANGNVATKKITKR